MECATTVLPCHAPIGQSAMRMPCLLTNSLARAAAVSCLLRVPLQSHAYCECRCSLMLTASAAAVSCLLRIRAVCATPSVRPPIADSLRSYTVLPHRYYHIVLETLPKLVMLLECANLSSLHDVRPQWAEPQTRRRAARPLTCLRLCLCFRSTCCSTRATTRWSSAKS